MIETPRQTRIRRVRRRPSLARRVLRIFTIAVILSAITFGAYAAYVFFGSSAARDAMASIITRSYTPSRAFPGRDHINLLILGRDQDRNNHGQVLNTRGRTDCIMLANIDFVQRTMYILSIPRDTLVRIPGYRGRRRVNSANALGGPELVQETVTDFLEVSPDYFVLADFDAFEKAIDLMGGLNVTVDKELNYDDNWGNLHIHLKPGQQHLDGYEAMGFVRYRKSNHGGGDSDLVRIGRQQELLRGFRAQLCSPGTAVRLPGIINTVRDGVEGNLTTPQMICLAQFTRSLKSEGAISMQTIPTLRGGGNYVHADLSATRDLVRRVFHAELP